jgi:hypothetical protein
LSAEKYIKRGAKVTPRILFGRLFGYEDCRPSRRCGTLGPARPRGWGNCLYVPPHQMSTTTSPRRRRGPGLAFPAVVLALLANLANFFLAGVLAGPVALAFASYGIWRCRGWARVVSVVAAALAIAAFVLALAEIYGLSHYQCPEAPECP